MVLKKGPDWKSPLLSLFFFTREGEWIIWIRKAIMTPLREPTDTSAGTNDRGPKQTAMYYQVGQSKDQLLPPADIIDRIIQTGDPQIAIKQRTNAEARRDGV